MCIRDRVLAVAYKPLRQETISPEDENGLTLVGYLAFFDAPKQSAADAIAKLQKLHVNVRVLTGDNQDTAVSICRRLGIDTAHTLTGAELERLTDNEISVKLEHTTVFSHLSPKQKVQVVQTLRANGHTVGFLGDGMNDLPAIVESDVGISVDTAAETVKEDVYKRQGWWYSAPLWGRRPTPSSGKWSSWTWAGPWLWTAAPRRRWRSCATRSSWSCRESFQAAFSHTASAPAMGICP